MPVRIQTPKESYTVDYPAAIKFAETQESIFWTSTEISVDKDIQDLKVNMTPAEYHGVITTLKLFVKYELMVGNEYWLHFVLKKFPRPEIERMASTFGFFELGVHAPFYNKINEALMLNTDEFYMSYVDDPVLASRIDFIGDLIDSGDDLLSLGAFSMVEGAVLYSSFAFLKHFQSEGKNKLLNVVRGINFSVRDENLHSEAGAWLFKTLLKERREAGEITSEEYVALTDKLVACAKKVYEHECQIIDMVFEKGEMEGITKDQMKVFVKSRINLCLQNLGIAPIFEVFNNTIAEWFYKNINAVSLHDFFTGIGSSYNRNWDQSRFTWKIKNHE